MEGREWIEGVRSQTERGAGKESEVVSQLCAAGGPPQHPTSVLTTTSKARTLAMPFPLRPRGPSLAAA